MHPAKALLPIDVTDAGTVRVASDVHPSNILAGIAVIVLGRAIEERTEHPAKAPFEIVSTVEGSATDVKLLQLENANGPISLRPSSNVSSVRITQR